MHAVRKHILEILKETGGATVAELAERLEMAPVSVRHHLDILQGDNLIRIGRIERTGNVGRPQQIYQLTEEANDLFPKNFAILATGIVRQLKERLPSEQIDAIFRSLAIEMAAEANLADWEKLSMPERLDRVIAFLNERGYLARWEPAADGENGVYMLHKHNCPYAGMSDEHHELCRMDQWLIDQLVGAPCSRTASVVNNDRCCTYQIEVQSEDKQPDAASRRQEILLAA